MLSRAVKYIILFIVKIPTDSTTLPCHSVLYSSAFANHVNYWRRAVISAYIRAVGHGRRSTCNGNPDRAGNYNCKHFIHYCSVKTGGFITAFEIAMDICNHKSLTPKYMWKIIRLDGNSLNLRKLKPPQNGMKILCLSESSHSGFSINFATILATLTPAREMNYADDQPYRAMFAHLQK